MTATPPMTATAPSLRLLVFIAMTATATARTTPAAIFQSSPMMKSYQNRPKDFSRLHDHLFRGARPASRRRQ